MKPPHLKAADPGFIYLASQSPRRQQLLRQIGVRFEMLLPGSHEDTQAVEALQALEALEALETHHPGETAETYVQRVTKLKLKAALQRLAERSWPAAPVLCADTTVVLGRRILGKPADAHEARTMLEALSGRTHRVLTAVAVSTRGRIQQSLSISRVHFEVLTPGQIEAYVASGEPMGKAGAYAIQSQAAAWISRIEGSYSGIMGLPLHETAVLLRRAGLVLE